MRIVKGACCVLYVFVYSVLYVLGDGVVHDIHTCMVQSH